MTNAKRSMGGVIPHLNYLDSVMFYVYLIIAEDGEKYIGYTSDLRRRINEYNSGQNRLTRNKHWRLAYYEAFANEHEARMRKYKLKHDGRSRRFLYERTALSMSNNLGAGEAPN